MKVNWKQLIGVIDKYWRPTIGSGTFLIMSWLSIWGRMSHEQGIYASIYLLLGGFVAYQLTPGQFVRIIQGKLSRKDDASSD